MNFFTDAIAILGLWGLALALGIGIHFGWRFASANRHVNSLIADHLQAQAINDAADLAITADE